MNSLNEMQFGDETILRDPKLDYYQIMQELESMYLENDYLNAISKEDYINFLAININETVKNKVIRHLRFSFKYVCIY